MGMMLIMILHAPLLIPPPLPDPQHPPPRLSALVCRNALLDLSQDLITASLRGDTPASHTGIWPLLSLINHSCAPNAVAVAIGQHTPLQQQQQGLLQQPRPQQQQQAKLPVNPWAGSSSSSKSAGRQAQASSTAAASSGSNAGSTAVSRGVGAEAVGGLSYCADAGVGPYVLVRAVTNLTAGKGQGHILCLCVWGGGGKGSRVPLEYHTQGKGRTFTVLQCLFSNMQRKAAGMAVDLGRNVRYRHAAPCCAMQPQALTAVL
jgi:hypothetical protein